MKSNNDIIFIPILGFILGIVFTIILISHTKMDMRYMGQVDVASGKVVCVKLQAQHIRWYCKEVLNSKEKQND